jgi:hypothetical protein
MMRLRAFEEGAAWPARPLLIALIAVETGLVAAAFLATPALPYLAAALLAPWVLTSVPRAIGVSLFLLIAIPTEANRYSVIPVGLQPEGIAALAVVPWVALAMVRVAKRDFRWRRTALDLPVALLLAAVALAAARGVTRGRGGYGFNLELLQWGMYATYFAASQGISDRRGARWVWGALTAGCVVVGIEYLWISLGAPRGEFGSFSRVTTHQAHVFALAVPALAARLLLDEEGARRRAVALLMPVMIGVLLSQLRSVFVAASAGIVVLVAVARRPALSWRRVATATAILAATVLAAVAVITATSQFARLPFSESLALRSEALGDPGRSPAMAIRVITYKLAWDERVAAEPLWGSGLGDVVSFPGGLRPFREYGFVDDAYLTAWWKLGLPGLLALLAVLGLGYRQALRAFRSARGGEDRSLALGLAGTIAAVTVLGLTTVVPAQMPFNGVWAVVLALPAILIEENRRAGVS